MRFTTTIKNLLFWLCAFQSMDFGAAQGISQDPPKPPPDPPANLFPYFVSSPLRGKHEKFLQNLIQLLLKDGVFFNNDRERRRGPFLWRSPETLSRLLHTQLGEQGTSHKHLLGWVKKVIKYSPHPSHPYMLDNRVAGLDPYALAIDWLIATANEDTANYIEGPVFVLLELEMVRRLGELFEWTEADGIATAGAGVANSLAVPLALQDKFPTLRNKSLNTVGNPKVVMFISEHASPAFEKAALFQGVGEKWVVKVNCDLRTGRMNMEDLRMRIQRALQKGLVPFMVVGTAGSRDLGAIDDLTDIAKVCMEFGLWFHVDAERGGAFIFHPKLRTRLVGIEKANSVTFGTWMLAPPYVTSMIMVQKGEGLKDAFGTHALYLYQKGTDLYNTTYDNGDSTVQTSRRSEIAKFWYTWKVRGANGMASLVKKVNKNAVRFRREVRKRSQDGFRLVHSAAGVPQVAFYYMPKKCRLLDENNLAFAETVSSITSLVKNELLKRNLIHISTRRLDTRKRPNLPEFFIASFTNSVLGPLDLKYILDQIRAVGEFKSKFPLARYTSKFPIPPLQEATVLTNAAWSNTPIDFLHDQFFRDMFQMFMDNWIFFNRGQSPNEFMDPEALKALLNLDQTQEGIGQANLLQEFKTALKYSPHRGHPYFFFQQLAGFHPYTLAADWVASALSTPMLTYEDSPVFTIMERSALAAMRKRIFGSSEGDGVMTDGGSMANQMAIAIALHVRDPRVRTMGLRVAGGKTFVGYMSQDAHYSTQKGFIHQNLGYDNVIIVVSDDKGRMRPSRLEAAIKRTLADGNIPFFVCITTGTTVYGAIDPVARIVKLCTKYSLWCHVDGMVGGLLAMSDDYVGRLAGLKGVDSFGTDFHKLLGATNTVALLITRRPNIFKETFGLKRQSQSETETSLYNRDKWDTGAYHWQLDKGNIVFKLWFLWKAIGRKGFEGHVNLVMGNAAYLVQQLHKRQADGFQLVLPEFDTTNVCFYYIPTSLRGANQPTNMTEFNQRLARVSYKLEKVLILNGVMDVVAQQRLDNDQPAFFKFVTMDSSLTKADFDYLLDAMAYYGEHLNSNMEYLK